MPIGTIDIYVDSSFMSSLSGVGYVKIEYPVLYADNRGEGIIPAFFTAPIELNGFVDSSTLFTAVGQTVSGVVDLNLFLNLASGTDSTVNDFPVIYSTPVTFGGLASYIDGICSYNTGQDMINGFQTREVKYFAGRRYDYFNAVSLSLFSPERTDIAKDFFSSYTAPSGVLTYRDVGVHSTFSGSVIAGGFLDASVESFFAGYVLNPAPFNVVCGISGSQLGSFMEASVDMGWVLSSPIQVIVGLSDIELFSQCEAFASLVSTKQVSADVDLAMGRLIHMTSQVICGQFSAAKFLPLEVDLLSLKISDLSIKEGQFVHVDGTLCVDITDDVYGVDVNGCYFLIDGVVASGIFTPIFNGYRMCYKADDLFASVLSATEFKVMARNNNGNVNWKSFYLTTGYNVEYDNTGQDYGHGNKVVIRMSAENFASCPAVGVFAYETEVVANESRDLQASIFAKPQLFTSNLRAGIYPNSTAYFYGKVIKVEVRAKDYAGNEMEPFIFEFRIEDKP